MTTKVRLLSVIPVAILVIGIFFANRLFESNQSLRFTTSPNAKQPAAGLSAQAIDESLPVIDFPLLGEARSLDLINHEIEFPETLKNLEGKRVRMVGFMAPYDSLNDMRRCMIVPSYVGCTFCSPPSLTQVVYVIQGSSSASARTFPFIEEASHITGTFRLSRPGGDREGQQQGFHYSLEDAIATPYVGDAPKRAPGHEGGPGQLSHRPRAKQLAPVAMEELVEEVAELFDREPLRPVVIEAIPAKVLENRVRDGLEKTYLDTTRAARTQAFSLLGMLPPEANWIDTLTKIQLAWRVAITDEKGEHVSLLDSSPTDHPYVRLVLVGEIAEALTRQRLRQDREQRGEPAMERKDDDARRAKDALIKGLSAVAIYRYAQAQGIPTSVEAPFELIRQKREERTVVPSELRRWQVLPSEIGPFFVDCLIGPNGPLSGIDPALTQLPTTTMEFYRPRWYKDASLWQHDPVPSNFADGLLEFPPTLTDVLGMGGLVPWLVQWYSGDVAKSFCSGWAGDRWAIWQFPDGDSGLLLETHWQDDDAALQFHDAIRDTEMVIHETGSRTVRVLRAKTPAILNRLTASLAAAP